MRQTRGRLETRDTTELLGSRHEIWVNANESSMCFDRVSHHIGLVELVEYFSRMMDRVGAGLNWIVSHWLASVNNKQLTKCLIKIRNKCALCVS